MSSSKTSTAARTAPKIPKGFVLVNLATWQQEKIRKLARESGVDLRDALRWALTRVTADLQQTADYRRKYGITRREFHQLFLWLILPKIKPAPTSAHKRKEICFTQVMVKELNGWNRRLHNW